MIAWYIYRQTIPREITMDSGETTLLFNLCNRDNKKNDTMANNYLRIEHVVKIISSTIKTKLSLR